MRFDQRSQFMAAANAVLTALGKPDRERVEAWLDSFESSWSEGQWRAFVPRLAELDPSLRLPALVETVKIDFERQGRTGRRVRLENYLQACPELWACEGAREDLARSEYGARQEFGGTHGLPALEQWLPRRLAQLQQFVDGAHGQSVASLETRLDNPTCQPTVSFEPQHAAVPAGEIVPEQFGRYRILKRLSEGGMGCVYLAHDPQFDREVALKVPKFTPDDPPEVRERFYREARAAATVDHPHLCPVYDVGELDGVPYLVMAYVQGKTLKEVMAGKSPPSARAAAGVVRKLALAMHEAHAKGVIHRDLKPANVKVNQRGEPVILDFGLAVRSQSQDVRLTQTGTVLGTPAYMPPEQVKGAVESIGPRSDVYSLGVVFYELLAGKLPHLATNVMDMVALILRQEPPLPSTHRPGLDPRLEEICMKAMAKKIDHRYRSMKEFADALTAYLKAPQQQPVGTSATQPVNDTVEQLFAGLAADPAPSHAYERVLRRRRRVPVWGWLALVLLPLTVLGVVIYVQTNHGTVRIEISDPKAKVTITVDGTVEVTNLDKPLRLKPGPHGLEVTGQDFETKTQEFTIKRGKNPAVRVTLVRKQIKVASSESDSTPPKPVKPDPGPQTLPKSSKGTVKSNYAVVPFNARDATAYQDRWAKLLAVPVEFTNSIGMKLVLIPPGKFTMGSPENETGRFTNESQVQVTLTQAYFLGRCEVTQGEWKTVMLTEPWKGESFVKEGRDYPATHVSWDDAIQFCRKLTDRERKAGRLPAGWEYALPTEAQWEYACRAGTTSRFSFGDDESKLGRYAWFTKNAGDAGEKYAHEVAQKLPNAFGLYDMHGNVWEWCRDWYGEKLPGGSDPVVTEKASYRVYRGGSWGNTAGYCRSAIRLRNFPSYRNDYLGFRVARVPAGQYPDPVPTPAKPSSVAPFRSSLVLLEVNGGKCVGVTTDSGICTVRAGGFTKIDVVSTDGKTRIEGKVGSRNPFPFCWVDAMDIDRLNSKKARLAPAGSHRKKQTATIAALVGGALKMEPGDVDENGMFHARQEFLGQQPGIIGVGPVFNAAGHCVGYGIRMDRGQPIKIYELKRKD
jgi:formylglycine-generating enzyme required for sulfatase activity/predicted Ser/Thr protein kinase